MPTYSPCRATSRVQTVSALNGTPLATPKFQRPGMEKRMCALVAWVSTTYICIRTRFLHPLDNGTMGAPPVMTSQRASGAVGKNWDRHRNIQCLSAAESHLTTKCTALKLGPMDWKKWEIQVIYHELVCFKMMRPFGSMIYVFYGLDTSLILGAWNYSNETWPTRSWTWTPWLCHLARKLHSHQKLDRDQ